MARRDLIAVVPSSPELGVAARARRRLLITGVVQGVGFRPFVHNLATRHGLGGFVSNNADGVVIEVEGRCNALEDFTHSLRAAAPPRARVDSLATSDVALKGEREFRIELSSGLGGQALVPPDIATCDACLAELFDPRDRRYRYPFINCTQCGPRFTIVRALPYDRERTTMAAFAVCEACRREYEDPADRRFHAEPIACPVCGPRVSLSKGCPWIDGDDIARAAALLRDGAIVAIKGLGGYHLACDATNEEAVARLRARKIREEKPFALMTADVAELADVGAAEERLLRSPAHPIVLVRRHADAPVAPSVAPASDYLGVMLPYTPLHHLLLADARMPLVMTSGNRSDEPIAYEDEDAQARLGEIADAFLSHDRGIERRCEDSVVRATYPIRRSRGYVPDALPLPVGAGEPVLSVGAELKGTFCLVRRGQAFMSPHLGDLDSPLARAAFTTDLALYSEMLGVEPEVVAHDLHPDYFTTRWALEQRRGLVAVQHHHAHAAACLAENAQTGPALALVFDGTGYGSDGTLWGGELLRGDLRDFERVAHLEQLPLPGGEAAIREPWRMAASYLAAIDMPVPWPAWDRVRESLKVNAPLTSGMGRLFDAAAALLGVRERVTYEGQAAVELEQLAGDTHAEPYLCRVEDGVIYGTELIAVIHDDLRSGRPREEIAAAFHEGVAAAGVAACEAAASPGIVALSGGSFQNLRLLRSTRRRLEQAGFQVLTHHLVPPGDAGISYGQAAVAAARMI
jgi:hydrogenase maturation protein HypF